MQCALRCLQGRLFVRKIDPGIGGIAAGRWEQGRIKPMTEVECEESFLIVDAFIQEVSSSAWAAGRQLCII